MTAVLHVAVCWNIRVWSGTPESHQRGDNPTPADNQQETSSLLIMQFQENADGELERAFRVPRIRWHENADGELEPPRQETRSLLRSSLDEDRMVKED